MRQGTKVSRAHCCTVLDRVENLVAESSCREALSIIEAVDRSDVLKFETVGKARLYYLTAKCLFRLGECGQALIKAKVAARLSRLCQDDRLHARVKLILGTILTELGRPRDALEELNESYVFSRRANDAELMTFSLSYIAQVHFISGNLRRSVEALKLALEHSSEYCTRKHADIDRRNLARVLIFTGDFRQARQNLEACCHDPEDLKAAASISSLEGMMHVFRQDFEAGREALAKALDYCVTTGFKRGEAVCKEYLGLLEYYLGNLRKAKEYYDEVLGMPEPTISAIAQTLRMMTDVHIAEGDFENAMETAGRAEEAIKRIKEHMELGALFRAYGQIFTHRGEYDVAKQYFKKSIDLLNDLGARYELANSYLASGTSEVYDHQERQRNLDLARMLFAEMGVLNRVDQVDRAIADLRHAIISAPPQYDSGNGCPTIIASGSKMKEILRLAHTVGKSDMNVLLTGETGTGKDLLALYIHYCSGRNGEFVDVNAAAIPNDMVESELFGHAKGAFTGATRDRKGLIETAHNGTFYLNEVADATPEFQAKLLQVLERREIRRLGETEKRPVNFRLIAATNHDMDTCIRERRFRLDLYHRIGEETVHLPALRERSSDIPELVRHFLSLISSGTVTRETNGYLAQIGKYLASRNWPGNIRELRSEVNRLWLAAGGNLQRMVALAAPEKAYCDRDLLARTLEETNWNRREAARRLGVCEGTIRYRVKKYNLN